MYNHHNESFKPQYFKICVKRLSFVFGLATDQRRSMDKTANFNPLTLIMLLNFIVDKPLLWRVEINGFGHDLLAIGGKKNLT